MCSITTVLVRAGSLTASNERNAHCFSLLDLSLYEALERLSAVLGQRCRKGSGEGEREGGREGDEP